MIGPASLERCQFQPREGSAAGPNFVPSMKL
jgi:hypothetical protein